MCNAFSRTGRSDQSVVARAVFADLENQGLRTLRHPSSVLFDRSKCVCGAGSRRARVFYLDGRDEFQPQLFAQLHPQ